MAKKIKRQKKKRSKLITYRTTCYQIQIKGPKRNKSFELLFDGLFERLKKGAPLARADKFGTVIRCLSGLEDKKSGTFELTLIKYNTNKTGLKWNESKAALYEDNDKENFSAQKTQLIIHVEKHKAFHIHKPHGPTATEIENYLSTIFEREKNHQKLDCSIDIIPLKVGSEVSRISNWKFIKKFSIEVIRPNPDGTVQAKELKALLKKTGSDKVALELTSKEKHGLTKSSISPLITEAGSLVDQGQGRVTAEGFNNNMQKVAMDSKDIKVRVESIKAKDDDERTLTQIILDYYDANL